MANPTLTPFPTPPLPEQDEATFNRNAANSLLAQANFVGEANTVVTWMGQQVTDVAANAKTAAEGAAVARDAKTYANSAQVAASIAEKSANLPPIEGKAGYVVTVTADAKGYSLQNPDRSGFQEFTSSGTFAKPAGARYFYIEVIGGGASGSVYNYTASNATVGGGDGGDYNFKLIKAADVPDSVSVTVGTGGAAVTSNNSNGNPGSASSFGNLVKAAGGDAGELFVGTTYTPVDREMRGGKRSGSSIKGSGGGCQIIYSSSGGGSWSAGVAGTSMDAGSGGPVGKIGVFPGGGGGANIVIGGNATSGAGAGGCVRIWWY